MHYVSGLTCQKKGKQGASCIGTRQIDQGAFRDGDPTGNKLFQAAAVFYGWTIESTGVLLPLMSEVRSCQYHWKALVVIFVTRIILNISLFIWTNKRKIDHLMIKYEYKSLIVSRNLLTLYDSSFKLWKIVKIHSPKTCNLTLFRLLASHENQKWICSCTVLYDVICRISAHTCPVE